MWCFPFWKTDLGATGKSISNGYGFDIVMCWNYGGVCVGSTLQGFEVQVLLSSFSSSSLHWKDKIPKRNNQLGTTAFIPLWASNVIGVTEMPLKCASFSTFQRGTRSSWPWKYVHLMNTFDKNLSGNHIQKTKWYRQRITCSFYSWIWVGGTTNSQNIVRKMDWLHKFSCSFFLGNPESRPLIKCPMSKAQTRMAWVQERYEWNELSK